MVIIKHYENRRMLWLPTYIRPLPRFYHNHYDRYKKRFALSFSHIQGMSNSASSTNSISVTLTTVPVQGDLVCVAFMNNSPITSFGVQDSNNNVYTVTPNSPSSLISGAGLTFLSYLLSAPANASATITASWSGGGSSSIFVDEFSYTGGSAVFDVDIPGSSSTSSTNISSPTITPTQSGELLYAGAAAGGTISLANSPWTGSGGAIAAGDWAEYDLSASAPTAVNFTQSSGKWSAMAMAFFIQPSSVQTTFLLNAW